MFRQLNFRSFFNFLGRNKLYAAINIFGLSVSLMFVILIADYTLRQLTCDDYHAKADRIYVIGNEERITSGYYLQKYLRDRYPEIESTCAVAVSGQSTDAMQPVEAGQGNIRRRSSSPIRLFSGYSISNCWRATGSKPSPRATTWCFPSRSPARFSARSTRWGR